MNFTDWLKQLKWSGKITIVYAIVLLISFLFSYNAQDWSAGYLIKLVSPGLILQMGLAPFIALTPTSVVILAMFLTLVGVFLVIAGLEKIA